MLVVYFVRLGDGVVVDIDFMFFSYDIVVTVD